MKKGFILLTTLVIISAALFGLLALVSLNTAAQKRALIYRQNRQAIFDRISAQAAARYAASRL
ncbi:MAG: hypothetical protein LBD99_05230 [Candidatus Margulisbacteria bacterium]|nr:hypothetical protein [Candidatus Margulisiibacteriota bacterium]